MAANEPPRNGLDYLTFRSVFRSNPERFWSVFMKDCSCEEGDVRYEPSTRKVECGACGRKLKPRK